MTPRQFRVRAERTFRSANPSYADDIEWGYVSLPFFGKRYGHFHAAGRLVAVVELPGGLVLVRPT